MELEPQTGLEDGVENVSVHLLVEGVGVESNCGNLVMELQQTALVGLVLCIGRVVGAVAPEACLHLMVEVVVQGDVCLVKPF
jgi:hypothetical protein